MISLPGWYCERAFRRVQYRNSDIPGDSGSYGVPDEPGRGICGIRTLGGTAYQEQDRRSACHHSFGRALLFLMGYQFWGAHEWSGAGMIILFIAHQACNLNWYKNLFRGRYTPIRILQCGINVLSLAAMLALLYSGIPGPGMYWRRVRGGTFPDSGGATGVGENERSLIIIKGTIGCHCDCAGISVHIGRVSGMPWANRAVKVVEPPLIF